MPDGAWIASFAGFSRDEPDRVGVIADVDAENSLDTPETDEPPAELETMLSELAGRVMEVGDARPEMPDSKPFGSGGDEGCWRTAKTNVWFIASLAHCGCMMYRSLRWACPVGWRRTKSYDGFSPV